MTAVPLIKGLFEEGAGTYPPSVINTTCNVRWNEIQSVVGGPLIHPNAIDRALLKGDPFRVRWFFGRTSPESALALGKVHVFDPTDGQEADVPRWWEADVQQAQADVIHKAAVEYDGQIPLIFIANGGTIYAEPFIRGLADVRTRENLRAAGYTPDLDKASYHAGYQMFRAFKTTRVAQAFNPWQYIAADGTAAIDTSFTLETMDAFSSVFPIRSVWQNNSVRAGSLGKNYDVMYAHMAAAHRESHRPISFQTAIGERVGSYVTVLQWAVDLGAHAVELSPGYHDVTRTPHLTADELAKFDKLLRAN